MADISDVELVLGQLTEIAVYPTGTGNPSVAAVTVTIAPGWPEPKELDGIIAAGNAMVTVFPRPGTEANTTRFLPIMAVLDSIPAAQLIMTVSGNQITLGGAISAGEAATALVNYQPYGYSVQENDTLATVAAALAAKIPHAAAVGPVITIGEVFDIVAMISVPVQMQGEIARQKRDFQISIWAPTPAIRALIGPAIDKYLKANSQKRILLPDNTLARLIYRGTFDNDHLAKQRIYRRDLLYEVEYVTSATETDNTVVSGGATVTPTGGTAVNVIYP